MTESGVWATIRAILQEARADPIRVENLVLPGTPDVNCTFGWIELKYWPRVPRDRDAFFPLDHFVPTQRAFLYRRWCADQRAWLLMRVADDWFIFDGRTAALTLGRNGTTYNELTTRAIGFWTGVKRPPAESLIRILRDGGRNT